MVDADLHAASTRAAQSGTVQSQCSCCARLHGGVSWSSASWCDVQQGGIKFGAVGCDVMRFPIVSLGNAWVRMERDAAAGIRMHEREQVLLVHQAVQVH